MIKELNARLAVIPVAYWNLQPLESVAILHALNTYEDEEYLAEYRKSLKLPLGGSLWKHKKSGNLYRVAIVLSRDTHDFKGHPPTIGYQSEDGRLWAHKIEVWYEKFEQVSEHE
jgi:hypothetical protein